MKHVCENLEKSTRTTLLSKDNFGWEILCDSEQTYIIYFELDNNFNRIKEEKSLFITAGYDVQVFEEAIKLRKEQINRENS